ncbi:MAG: hypothetical protein DRI94_13175 [Bacteroidetes bacterium]|nr:MAG: hypothetical protein DRI94_13175 [Bacteroidota bacterium]
MKKNIITLLSISLIAVLFLSNCKKDEDTTTPEAMTTAIIKGKVFASLNTANDTTSNGFYQLNQETAPVGTKIIAVVNAADLVVNPIAGHTYEDITFETTVDANGEYSITVDAIAQDANYTIKAQDFIYDQTVMDVYPATKTERKVFTAADQNTSIVKNNTKVIDITYN